VAEVVGYGVRHVCVTGGEPLAQKRCLVLLRKLCDAGLEVSLETSGAIDVALVDPRVSRVLDIKTPDSGEEHRNLAGNLPLLTARDQIKFVSAVARTTTGHVRGRSTGIACALHGVVLAEQGPWMLASWPTGSSPTACPCASRCNCTNCCGTTNRAADRARAARMR
jgi:hypothetical protein